MSELSLGKGGRVTPWTSQQFITGPQEDKQPFVFALTPMTNSPPMHGFGIRKDSE